MAVQVQGLHHVVRRECSRVTPPPTPIPPGAEALTMCGGGGPQIFNFDFILSNASSAEVRWALPPAARARPAALTLRVPSRAVLRPVQLL